jgi:hypothetical protein
MPSPIIQIFGVSRVTFCTPSKSPFAGPLSRCSIRKNAILPDVADRAALEGVTPKCHKFKATGAAVR